MQEFDLEWFNCKTLNKQIKIESSNTEGEIGVKVDVIINDIEIEKSDTDYWDGYVLTINENINLCFEKWEISPHEDCEHILILYRSNEGFICVSLPLGDTWVDDRTIGFPQY